MDVCRAECYSFGICALKVVLVFSFRLKTFTLWMIRVTTMEVSTSQTPLSEVHKWWRKTPTVLRSGMLGKKRFPRTRFSSTRGLNDLKRPRQCDELWPAKPEANSSKCPGQNLWHGYVSTVFTTVAASLGLRLTDII